MLTSPSSALRCLPEGGSREEPGEGGRREEAGEGGEESSNCLLPMMLSSSGPPLDDSWEERGHMSGKTVLIDRDIGY